MQSAIDILEKLVGIKSVSGRPNHEIVAYVKAYLADHGVEASLSYDDAGERANVLATIGPSGPGGVMLNGHTDVVSVEGQEWATDPFKLTRVDDRLYGRGSVDMKGYLACILASVPLFKTANLQQPIHIAFSFDEETGGWGMPILLDDMRQRECKPDVVIIGEPTNMKMVTGHKGGYEMRTEIIGHAVHSCDPTKGANAINAAMTLIQKIEEMGEERANNPIQGSSFEPPYPTFNIGTIEGGTARNATAGWCNFNWEYRPMPGEDGDAAIAEIDEFAQREILPDMQKISADARIDIIKEVALPALDNRNAAKAVEFVGSLTGINNTEVVSFGTDGGYFSDDDFSTVIIGPGDIGRAHKADEYITTGELEQGLDFMKKVAARLSA